MLSRKRCGTRWRRSRRYYLRRHRYRTRLLELFGLVSFIDTHVFGDLRSFREQFANPNDASGFKILRERLSTVCHRTLRRQVTAYIPYTKRFPILEEFTPEVSENRLYDLVSAYLQRDNLEALAAGQRSLITLVLRKLLASSTFAIAGALTTLLNRLKSRRGLMESEADDDLLGDEYEALSATQEEWNEEMEEKSGSASDQVALVSEIAELQGFVDLALSIENNGKGKSLLKALKAAFVKANEMGAAEKAIIFTESRKTQDYLVRLLQDSPYANGIVLFNGSNSDDRSKQIYTDWKERHRGTDRVTGSRTADMRSALVDYFRDEGRIMIATEAGAEGINLQFCSLVVNYDLPWNPQRIEQRIGRCHRYGQKHDVVVVNFVNRQNEADKRVYELLDEKFRLFDGVFGASDEVLGALESGVDFEKRIAAIYQECRHPDEIKKAFDTLQRELSSEINEAMTRTREKLFEHFDDEVREKLRMRDIAARASLGRVEEQLMLVTRHELRGVADFVNDSRFLLHEIPGAKGTIPTGIYELPRRSDDAHIYRLNHPLAEALLARAKKRELPTVEIVFDYSGYTGKISALEPFLGQSGWLSVSQFSVAALDQTEDHLLFVAVTDDGEVLEPDTARRLLGVGGHVGKSVAVSGEIAQALETRIRGQQGEAQRKISERNADFFGAEIEKLDGWAEDLKTALEREIKEIDRQIKEARRAASVATTLEQKLAGQKQIKALEAQRNTQRRSLFTAQDEVDNQREGLIKKIEGRMSQGSELVTLFTIRWRLQ